MFVYTLKDFKILNSLCCITVDNSSNKNKLAKDVSELTNQRFNHHKRLLGCMAHIINLAAQDGLKFFFTSAEGDPDAEISIKSSPMSISNMVSTPDGTSFDLKTVINRIHSLSVHIARTSEAPGDLEVPESEAQTATSLILDHTTYVMLAIFTPPPPKDPSHQVSLKICISNSQHRHSNVYRTHERNHITDQMVKKLKKYLIPALKKPGPIWAMILDPCIKTTHFENNRKFLLDELKVHMTPDACVSIFQTKALNFENSKTAVPISSASQQNIKTSRARLSNQSLPQELQLGPSHLKFSST
ncbi:uncharacterized protein VP01_7386g1 [Puccinia sorghi]|uniref:hAT-like transposase RNase-H fold domain-containing protein n=1 Tax=Puccinia sorghi TaxID=27349 RepID=A0A0L6UDH9_9BASI|nr:uncharacterized protein VP01_7386g1 [Puccinia sorghi]